jgi:DNA-binding MarR family transcriptional regulator
MPQPSNSAVSAVRQFNRFYTRKIGVLQAGHLGSPFSITEVRVLFELAHRRAPTATEIGAHLGLDAGYLSRILRRFERAKLIARVAASHDRRRSHIKLTRAGRLAFAPLDKAASTEIETMLAPVGASAKREIVAAMAHIERSLEPESPAGAVILRRHRVGDIGWVIHRHGALYAAEYGYNVAFESLVARICADFIDHHDPARERCWIAERDGAIVGSVFLVRKSATVAKLRMLYLEPEARGIGLGRRLVDECIAFARDAGYRKVTLWTQSSLVAARHLYQTAGFVRTASKPHSDFGPRELAETWDLVL